VRFGRVIRASFDDGKPVNRVTLIGGPLDGRSKQSRVAPKFVWAQDGEAGPLRLFQVPGENRHLYRMAQVERVGGAQEQRYLYAGHSHAYCCGAYHQRPDVGTWRCTLCGGMVVSAR
jgi:hypothetical protein